MSTYIIKRDTGFFYLGRLYPTASDGSGPWRETQKEAIRFGSLRLAKIRLKACQWGDFARIVRLVKRRA